jgi:hypothetical protein
MSTTLSAAEAANLREIAGTMIPASAESGMPGADDPVIQADLVKSLGRDVAPVREAIAAIFDKAGGDFAGLSIDKREALIADYTTNCGLPAAALGRAVLSAYYRDDRVLVALGQEARAPFPKGYALEQGDWSLLEAVKKRAPFWRKDA